jgi:DsbC/DsbD-like thiol-disulfide interchange protein
MTPRLLSAGLGVLLMACSAAAEPKPYRVSLIGDKFDGKYWHTGVLIELDPGWKTYWRMPGEAGVSPEFTWTPAPPAEVSVSYPAPARYADASGETVGYEGEVLFPVTVKAGAADDVELGLDLFFAVCKDICIPAKAQASITLGREARDPPGAARVETARALVPVAGDAISAATITEEGGKPVLELALARPVEDIFAESPTPAYFRAPVFTADGRAARLSIDNVGAAEKLRGQVLTLTYRSSGKAYEQTLKLN